jgi:acetoin utilization protein AcuB
MSKELTVESVMKKPVITLKPTSSIMEAADLTRKENIGCIVVTEDEKPVGIITERDLIYWFLKMLGYPEKREVIERLK